MTKHLILLIVAARFLSAFTANAQDGGENWRDSLSYMPGAALDSTLQGKNIFDLLPSKEKGDRAEVSVHQSQYILNALNAQIASNATRMIVGYRVRIFNDNKQDARSASEAVFNSFKSMYPGISAYRSYTNPFFKVTVGDFRTKSEAMQLLQDIKGSFPRAFIVKENIGYPAVGRVASSIPAGQDL